MLAAAALALGLFGHHLHVGVLPHGHGGPAVVREVKVGHWHLQTRRDTFTGSLFCQVRTRGMSVRSDTLIFRLGHGVETTHAWFRVDNAPARQVAEGFAQDERHGIFPERGWIDEEGAGEVALPLAFFEGASRVSIRVSTHRHPHRFNVTQLPAVLAAAKDAGCPSGAIQTVAAATPAA